MKWANNFLFLGIREEEPKYPTELPVSLLKPGMGRESGTS
jgi:hypothetical protein